MITAPFNFVPLSEKVFFPDWADKVSHDIPFSDGESGVIDITITAKSPIFIRDHEKKEEFCQHNGQYYIPSSSVKGMIRNVLEIMSFSKMSQFNDDTYAVRDLSSAKNFYMSEMKENVLCGWLYKDGDDYRVEDCGEPYRISHQEIDKALNIEFSSKFTRSGFEKTSEYKYNIVGGTHQKVKVGEPYKSKTNAKYDKRLFCKYDSLGKTGTLVLTGQPTVRKNTGKMGDGKGFEFVFIDKKNPKSMVVDKTVFENFLFAYFDKRTTEPKESPDWTYWKNKLNNGERVAVFFKKKGDEVAHFGLSYLYKLPYKHSVSGGIAKIHRDDSRNDLAQTIFGYIGDNKALKGRVQFSHFKAVRGVEVSNPPITEVLGTPRASYYPMYVKQENGKLFTTFMDDRFNISGQKRYPVHKTIKTYPLPINKDGKVNKKVGTTFAPLKEGVVFEGKMRYHNLKKAELGALLSALTFHNTQGCFHNIGMAKSLGYGKIELKVNGIELNDALKAFEIEITSSISNWAESEQLKELLTMATEQDNEESSELRYMELKEFATHKSRDKDYLRNYTALDNIKTVTPHSLISEEDLERLKVLQEEKKREEKLREEQKEIELKLQEEKEKEEKAFNRELTIVNNELEKDEVNLQILQNFIEKYPNYEKIDEIKSKKDEIENSQKANRYKEVNEKAKSAYEALQKKKGNQKQYLKEKAKFIKKWSEKKNHKGSDYILQLIEKLK